MASVQDLKDILITEQTRLAEISEKSIAAISGVFTVASFVIVIFATGLTLLALIGWQTIKAACINKSEKITKAKVQAHINSPEFRYMVEDKIHDYMSENWENNIISTTLDIYDKGNQEESPFPSDVKKGEHNVD